MALIGHRVAHGGDLFTESVIISEEVINNIRQVSSLAPLHNYASLSGIASAQRLFPEVMQVAVFDTSFHQTLAPEAFLYGLPWEYYQNLGYAATVSTAPRTAMCPSAPWRCSGCRSRRAAW
ncbi:propionate kinase [Klebsiella pneumoniae]|uniref:Propionate kinase n=1 Tax=Klebsiella pneumoniae TaxID=573 RepID=A0A2X3EKG0_KLEPN|nr:propionate kinase [Klebsiella pneumoniae]